MDGETRLIAVVGGSGALGRGLALRLGRAGHRVIVGSRDAVRAEAAAADIPNATGMENAAAAAVGEIVILTVPFDSQAETLRLILPAIEGKILVDATVALKPPKVGTVQLPPEGSAGLVAARLVEGRARLVSAFQNVSAVSLAAEGAIDCDVLVTSDDTEAARVVVGLCADMGVRGLHAGPIANSVATEALTSLLITLNRRFKAHSGIRITGLEHD